MLFRAVRTSLFPSSALVLAAVVLMAGCGAGSSVPSLQNNPSPMSSPAPISSPTPTGDPWLTSGLTLYTVLPPGAAATLLPVSGPTPAPGGVPAGAQMLTAVNSVLNPGTQTLYTASVAQDINGAATLPAGTKVTVSGYFYITDNTASSDCSHKIVRAAGAYAVGIKAKSGTTVITLAGGASTGWVKLSGSTSITTPGPYQAVWMATGDLVKYYALTPTPDGYRCKSRYINGQGFATDLSAQAI